MDRKIIHITFFTVILGVFVCCTKNKDDYYFNGDIRYIDSSSKIVKNVTCKSIQLDGIQSGMIAVYDSLLICWQPNFPNHFFNIINLDSGKDIGFFCEKGQGPKEAVSVNCIFQFFKKGNDLITLLDSNEGKLFFWNISQSIEKGTTVYDTIIPYSNHIFFHFYKSEDTLFAFKSSDFLNLEEVSTPFYEKRTIYSNELIRNYPIYKKSSVRNIKAERFFIHGMLLSRMALKLSRQCGISHK
jgi:hypothetical protein